MARKKSIVKPQPPQAIPGLSGSNSTPPQTAKPQQPQQVSPVGSGQGPTQVAQPQAAPQAQPAQSAKPQAPQQAQSGKLAPQGAQSVPK